MQVEAPALTGQTPAVHLPTYARVQPLEQALHGAPEVRRRDALHLHCPRRPRQRKGAALEQLHGQHQPGGGQQGQGLRGRQASGGGPVARGGEAGGQLGAASWEEAHTQAHQCPPRGTATAPNCAGRLTR